MAGLRVWPGGLGAGWTAEHACQLIAGAAAGRTTLLSAAWIRHAAAGEFGEPWHDLVRGLAATDEGAIRRAAGRILATGATSGAAALAGFLAPVRGLHVTFTPSAALPLPGGGGRTHDREAV
jgi:hypothetical protein